jgi:hypothetical protein
MREQGMFDPARLVFIDDSANTKMVRLYGRCVRGGQLVGRCAARPGYHFRSRHASSWHESAADNRRFNDRKEILGLCRTVSRSDAQTQGYRDDR